MANSIVNNGTVTVTTSTLRLITDTAFNITLSGSNAVGTVDNITTQSYQALNTSSLSDVRYIIASNEDLTGSISIATDSAGTNQISYLAPGDSAVIPWSGSAGSTTLYAKAFKTTASSSLLQYVICES
jgi:hypothetical protein